MEGYKPKVTIIVPIYYRLHPYLERCCRSLFGQTLEDIEFIFIVDGPSESAEQIISDLLTDYPQRQPQTTIVKHPENLGISYSRQEGHAKAKGDYLYHCDSDDRLEQDAMQKAYGVAVRDDADLVFFDYVRHYEESGKDIIYSSSHVEQGQISTMDGTLCNKLIRRQFLSSHNLRFPEGINWGEDLCMSVLLQILAKKIAYLPQVFYHYYLHANSFTTNIEEKRYLQLVTCPLFLEQELATRQLAEQYDLMIFQMKFEVKEYYLIHPKLRNVKRWLTIYPECHPFIWQYASVPVYLKIVAWLAVNHMQWLAEFLLDCRNLIHRIRR